MTVETTKKFDELVLKIKDTTLKKRLLNVIEKLEKSETLRDIHNVKAIIGFHGYYRIKIGDFRLGFLMDKNTVKLLYIGKRDENTYHHFP